MSTKKQAYASAEHAANKFGSPYIVYREGPHWFFASESFDPGPKAKDYEVIHPRRKVKWSSDPDACFYYIDCGDFDYRDKDDLTRMFKKWAADGQPKIINVGRYG